MFFFLLQKNENIFYLKIGNVRFLLNILELLILTVIIGNLCEITHGKF